MEGAVTSSVLAAAGSWIGDRPLTAGDLWHLAGLVAPLLFVALLLWFIVAALVRQRRYRVVEAFGQADRTAVQEALKLAERRTVGEILPVVVERSDPHPGADWLAALASTLVGSALLAAWLPWDHPALLLVCQIAMGALGFALARLLPDFKRRFIFEDRATAVAHEQALQEFYGNGLHKTAAATGVLLFVSLLEHRVIILADEGIDAKVDAEFWANADDAILEGVRRGSLRQGLIDGIERAAESLAEHFPWREGDRNEIPDRVIVRRQ